MKSRHLFIVLLLALAAASRAQVALPQPVPATNPQAPIAPAAPLADPTKASPRVRAALAEGTGLSTITVKGMVLGSAQSGTVLLDIPGQGNVLARPRVPFTALVDGAPRKLLVKSITSEGLEIESPLQGETVLIPSYGAEARVPPGVGLNVLPYVDFREVALIDALRMLADQSGQNYSASAAANKTLVNALLRNLSAGNVVEEICKSHNLYFKKDEVTHIIRVLTIDEFQRDLIGFREEQTEVFTLKFPNVLDVALAIADLYGDRVRLSLGTEYQDEDTNDLETRFDRFDVVNQRGQLTTGTNNNSNFNGSNTSYNGNNGFSFGSNGRNNNSGSGNSRNGNSSSNRGSYSNQRRSGNNADDYDKTQFQGLTSEQAQRLSRAVSRTSGEGDGTIESLRARPAHIYVTASRRNSIVGVRSADKGAMDEIRKLVHRLDVRTPMVLLEVKVLSVELGDDLRTSFDYEFNNNHIAGAFSTGGGIDLPGGFGAGLRSSDMTFTVVSDNFRARIQALEERRRVKSLATPLLLTANNEVSRLFLGEERPLVRNVSSQTIITDNNVATSPNTTVEFRNVGNTLLITPNINADRTVTLRLLQENSFISPTKAQLPVVTNTTTGRGGNGVENVNVDVVSTRNISGTFVAKDNLAVAIGGLIDDSSNDTRAGVPFIDRIPVVGFFFRRTEKSKARRELIIMIRPHIISTPSDSQAISKDVLQKLAAPDSQRLLNEGLWPTDESLPPLPASPAKTKPVATPIPKARVVVERKQTTTTTTKRTVPR